MAVAPFQAVRKSIFFAAMLLCATSLEARAELVGVFFQGHGGVAGGDSSELMPGGAEPGLGSAVGLKLGAHLFMLEGYYDRTAFSSGGTVSRGIVGLRGSADFTRLRLTARAGLGMMWEEDDVLGGMSASGERSGGVARAGLALDYRFTRAVYVGAAFDAEAFAIAPDDAAMDDYHTGTDVMGTLHLGFELGL